VDWHGDHHWMTALSSDQRAASVCHLETIGRVSGNPHVIEIWFAAEGDTIWLLSGGLGRSDWVRNLKRTPAVRVRICEQWLNGLARVVVDRPEDQAAREAIAAKYYDWRGGSLPNEWSRTALPVAVQLTRSD
jgi:deazaflavin-dependent oxidoreductase (nitroreductase family)